MAVLQLKIKSLIDQGIEQWAKNQKAKCESNLGAIVNLVRIWAWSRHRQWSNQQVADDYGDESYW